MAEVAISAAFLFKGLFPFSAVALLASGCDGGSLRVARLVAACCFEVPWAAFESASGLEDAAAFVLGGVALEEGAGVLVEGFAAVLDFLFSTTAGFFF